MRHKSTFVWHAGTRDISSIARGLTAVACAMADPAERACLSARQATVTVRVRVIWVKLRVFRRCKVRDACLLQMCSPRRAPR